MMESCKKVLTLESVDKILMFDHSDKTSKGLFTWREVGDPRKVT